MTSGNDIPSFPGGVLFFSILKLWTNLNDVGGACTWRGDVGFL